MTSASPPVAAAPASASRRVPLDKRKRTETSCDKCKSRKQKCRKEAGQDACRYCLVHHIDCRTTQVRKRRLYGSVEGVGNRLALLEALVKGLLPEADVSNMDEMRELGVSMGIALPEAVMAGADGSNGNGGEHKSSNSDREGEDSLSLLPDQQGQVQYIGPASSFSFHLKVRTLVGPGHKAEFVLFGRNAADQEPLDDDAQANGGPNALTTPSATSSPSESRTSAGSESPSFESLIAAYFLQINPDFPVLHEANFRETYEAWVADPGSVDPAWMCCFLCMLLLARRVSRVTFPEDQERLWWRRVQTLLPMVIFTSSVAAVQAMLLASMHLHNTNHRDACWNLTGTAVRIAFAIGLHQDKVSTLQTPLARELRKRLWWTLYAFEQMQVSSYDRPSAIEHPGFRVSYPNERIIGMASYCPPDYSKCFNRLVVHLGSACRVPKTIKHDSREGSYVGPLSPAASVLRDMERWREQLPLDLRMEALNTAPVEFQRPLLLLHAMYHYTVLVLCRATLYARASRFAEEGKDSPNTPLTAMADSCAESGRELAEIVLKLDSFGKFDPITWWDIWYTLTAGSVLLLNLVCLSNVNGTGLSESRGLIAQLSDLAQRHKRNPHMPATIATFATRIPELQIMAQSMKTSPSPAVGRKVDDATNIGPGPSRPSAVQPQEIVPYPYHQSSTNGGAYMFADNVPNRYYHDTEFIGGPYQAPRLDRSTQMGFMDYTLNNINDWNWGELGNLLGNETVPNLHQHVPVNGIPGPPPPGPPGPS
jgi:hypothetical protein